MSVTGIHHVEQPSQAPAQSGPASALDQAFGQLGQALQSGNLPFGAAGLCFLAAGLPALRPSQCRVQFHCEQFFRYSGKRQHFSLSSAKTASARARQAGFACLGGCRLTLPIHTANARRVFDSKVAPVRETPAFRRNRASLLCVRNWDGRSRY